MRINGRTVVVTGASRGIGRAVAERMGEAGARVALLARSPEVEGIAAGISASGGTARGYMADVTDAAAVADAVARLTRDLGAPEILVNNAGIGRWLDVEETPPEEAAAMVACPYLSAFYATRAVLPGMLGRNEGAIVNVNSPAAWFVWPGATGYTAARWALRGFTEALRADLRSTGIHVMAVVPGKTSSTYFENNEGSEERMPRITSLVPSVTPDEVASALVRGLERGRRNVVLPPMLRAVLLTHALAPALVDWLMWRTGWRRTSAAGEEG